MISLIAAMLSVISYKFVVQRQGTAISYLVGFGFLMPLWLAAPYNIIHIFGIENKVMKFTIGSICPTLGLFHTSEGKKDKSFVVQPFCFRSFLFNFPPVCRLAAFLCACVGVSAFQEPQSVLAI